MILKFVFHNYAYKDAYKQVGRPLKIWDYTKLHSILPIAIKILRLCTCIVW